MRPPLSAEDRARIVELRYRDGLTSSQVAARVGCHKWTVRRYAPGWPGKVDNAKLREAFLASGISAAEVARRLGWTYEHPSGRLVADGSRVRRTLGLQDDVAHGLRTRRRLVDAEIVALMADAIGVAPWAVGADELAISR